MLMVQKGDNLLSFDLKLGYHHVDIHERYWEYLGFAWDNGNGKKYFCFKVRLQPTMYLQSYYDQ